MVIDTCPPFAFPAVQRKKITAAFDGGRISSDGGVMLLAQAERRLGLVKFVARNELARRFMAIPGVGPVTALSFIAAIDDPSRFRRSRDVAAYFGLTSRRWQSGTSIDVQGRISKAGDPDVRRTLYEAASSLMTRFKGKDKVKTWGQALTKRGCQRKATVAVARKLGLIIYAMWRDGAHYISDPAANSAEAAGRAHGKNRLLLGAYR